jgi:tRNA A37 threonylcarbamoyladenosine biosynthesis protein TsaE
MFAGGLFHIRRVAMTKVDLITGFLGSGKTTFIRKYV